MGARGLAGLAAGLALTFPALGASAAGPIETAFLDPWAFGAPGAQGEAAFGKARLAGARFVRIQMIWSDAVPEARPKGFRPTDPTDPAYDWRFWEGQVSAARRNGIEPIVYIETAPAWAQKRGPWGLRADPSELGKFALAAARHFSGRVRGVPRVRYWQAWNEPNKVAGPAQRETAADWYRAIVKAFSEAVHSVHADNSVIAGGLSPFGIRTAVAPLEFMRNLLCLSNGPAPKPTCRGRVPFDIWSAHPYTSGGPTHSAFRPDDVSLGDLAEMGALLRTAVRAGKVLSRQKVRFWVTEFSWDSKPPDPEAVPMALHTRWVAEALYRMWVAGVSLCTWFRLSDDPVGRTPYQSGLYFHAAHYSSLRPKPSLQAFRFPFVALRGQGGLLVWGRTPPGSTGRVAIQLDRGSGYRRIAILAPDRHGIFSARLPIDADTGFARAELLAGGERSVPFSLVVPPDRFVYPFGS